MEDNNRNIAVILAGGTGSRLGASTPKQFMKVAGKMVIEHTIDVFEHHQSIDEIAVVVYPDYINLMEEIVLKNHWRTVKKSSEVAPSAIILHCPLFKHTMRNPIPSCFSMMLCALW